MQRKRIYALSASVFATVLCIGVCVGCAAHDAEETPATQQANTTLATINVDDWFQADVPEDKATLHASSTVAGYVGDDNDIFFSYNVSSIPEVGAGEVSQKKYLDEYFDIDPVEGNDTFVDFQYEILDVDFDSSERARAAVLHAVYSDEAYAEMTEAAQEAGEEQPEKNISSAICVFFLTDSMAAVLTYPIDDTTEESLELARTSMASLHADAESIEALLDSDGFITVEIDEKIVMEVPEGFAVFANELNYDEGLRMYTIADGEDEDATQYAAITVTTYTAGDGEEIDPDEYLDSMFQEAAFEDSSSTLTYEDMQNRVVGSFKMRSALECFESELYGSSYMYRVELASATDSISISFAPYQFTVEQIEHSIESIEAV